MVTGRVKNYRRYLMFCLITLAFFIKFQLHIFFFFLQEADLTALRNFISTKKPHVIAVGGESRDALMVVQDLKNVVKDLIEDDQFPSINVEIIDNDLAKIYANSNKSEVKYDFPIFALYFFKFYVHCLKNIEALIMHMTHFAKIFI